MKKENPSNHSIDRREFLRRFHAAMAVAGVPALSGCQSDKHTTSTETSTTQRKKEGGMTYRTTPTTGDKVSLLGYGCMRWFTLRDKKTGIIDQERVNWLVDYAIEHGVNYFDTAPVYCDGECERVTGIALNRHPRDKYYIAAKISNLEPDTWSREETLKMYNNSFKELQMDYIDYLLSLHDEGKYTWDFVQIQLNYVDWRHAQEEHARNINAEYLYNELAKRNIPSVIMEPLLGGRLAKVHAHIAAILKQRRPDLSIASWAFRFAGTHPMVLSVLSGMPYMEHLKENIETY